MSEMTLDQIKSAFSERGFKFWADSLDQYKPGSFYKQVETKRQCAANDKDQITVTVYDRKSLHLSGHRWSFEVKIVGELPSGVWAACKIYSLDETNIFERLQQAEAALIRAWEALA